MAKRNHNNFYILIVSLLLAFFCSSCEYEDNVTLNGDLIFPEAIEIKIPAYSYQYQLENILVHGDAGFSDGIVDTLSTMPVLQWDSTQTSLIVAAIFAQPIQMVDNLITNTDDIVWIWHSGLESGKDGLVEFEEGKSITDGDINILSSPVALAGTGKYYWGVWGWNESGVKVLYSSRPLSFVVKDY